MGREPIKDLNPEFLAVTVGTSEEDFQKAVDIYKLEDRVKFLCSGCCKWLS